MSEGEFRKAENVAESNKGVPFPKPKDPKVAVGPEEKVDDAPISYYKEINGHPYTAKFFDVIGIYRDPDIGLYSDILDIEEAYKKRVESGDLEDGAEYFKIFIDEAEKATSCKNATRAVRIAKVAEWVRFMNNLKKIERKDYV